MRLNWDGGNANLLRGTNALEITTAVGPWGGGEVWIGCGGYTNSFTGPITLWPGAGLRTYSFSPTSGSALGSTNADLVMHSGYMVIQSGTAGAQITQKRDFYFEGLASFRLDCDVISKTNTLRFASMNRLNRGAVAFYTYTGGPKYFGANARVIVDSGVPTPTNGMVTPYIGSWYWSGAWAWLDPTFMNYLPDTGFTNAVFTRTGLSGATATDIVDAATTGSETVPSGGVTVYALRAKYPLLANASGDKISIASGGLILHVAPANPTVHTAPLDFGDAEGIIWAPNGNIHRFDGIIMARNGITFCPSYVQDGYSQITLNANNSTSLFGRITVNGGVINCGTPTCLGPTTNVVYLNGMAGGNNHNAIAGLNLNGQTISNPVELGPCGGSLCGSGTMNGKISGVGPLGLAVSGYLTINSSNDYTGGTYVYNDMLDVGANGYLG